MNIADIYFIMFVSIQHLCYLGILRSYRSRSMLAYLYHWMFYIFKSQRNVSVNHVRIFVSIGRLFYDCFQISYI